MFEGPRAQFDTSDAGHYRPQLNPEFARRARENNRKRKKEAEAVAREEERLRKQREALEAIERAKAKPAIAEQPAPVVEAEPEPEKPVVVRTEFQRILSRLLPVLGVSVTELRSPRRHKQLVFARQAVAYWACRRTELSLVQIGRLLGNKDHTTILWARDRYPGKRAAMGRKLRQTR